MLGRSVIFDTVIGESTRALALKSKIS